MRKKKKTARVRAAAFMLALALFICLPAAGAGNSSYANDGPESFITGISIDVPVAESYQKVGITVSFSDGGPNENVFQGGDTIEISWPSSGEAYLKGFVTEIPLISPDGVTYAKVSVSSSGAVITFNDNVNNMYDISGSFYFEALAINADDSGEENTATVSVTSGGVTADLDIHKGATAPAGQGGEPPDFRKEAAAIGGWTHVDGMSGWVMTLNPDDPTYTEWILTANEKKQNVSSDIVIKDQIRYGQEIDRSFAVLYSSGELNASYSGSLDEVITGFMSDFPGSSITIDESGMMVWTIDQSAADKEAWYFTYRCFITDFSLQTFDNSADISWEAADGTVCTGHSESSFANMDQGGDIHALPRGVLQITKKVGGTDLTLPGVTFVLERYDADGWTKIAELTTDDRGVATLNRLRTGHYRLYETEAPDYLEMAYTVEHPYEFDLDTDSETLRSLALTIENSVRTTDISAAKVWLDPDGAPDEEAHPDIWFQLYRKGANGKLSPVGEPVMLPDGTTEVLWEDLPMFDIYGNEYVYEVEETNASGELYVPEGYVMEKDDMTITNHRLELEPQPPVEPDKPEPPEDPDKPEPPEEPDKPEPPAEPDKPDEPTVQVGSNDQGTPKTGDTARPGLWIGLASTAGILLILELSKRRRINKLFSRKR